MFKDRTVKWAILQVDIQKQEWNEIKPNSEMHNYIYIKETE